MTKEQILEHYDIVDGCWIWRGGLTTNGYGAVQYRDSVQYVHRLMYEIVKGVIPRGKCVCHACDTPSCINPEHLFLGTQKDNLRDAARKRRVKTKLTERDVQKIRKQLLEGKRQIEIAEMFEVSRVCISKISCGVNWAWLT